MKTYNSRSAEEPMPSLWDGKYLVYSGRYKSWTWDRVPFEYLQLVIENGYRLAPQATLELARRRALGIEPEAPKMMPFGIHKNKPFEVIPEHYLRWVVANIKCDMLVAAVEDHLRLREHQAKAAS